ncbi:MAG TPA: ornithine cyclodeaminase family protein [Candidatus Sulfotelmatobacter sp.]|nr:ornithine cyclodeaminase family protein [Candidatus Sulfotelmatobacter sp.]
MKTYQTLLLTRRDVSSLLTFEEYVTAVEEAFRLHAAGNATKPGLLHVDSTDGEFHIKAGGLKLQKQYFALKVNGGFFHNAERFSMPNIQGLIVLFDGENGYPLAVMDSRVITSNRTGAATAVAAKYLAKPESKTATIFGSGVQARIQLRALVSVLPIKTVYVVGRNQSKLQDFQQAMSKQLDLSVELVEEAAAAVRNSDVCVTCTPSRRAILHAQDVAPGTFIAAVGADSPDKQELEPELLRRNKVVVDLVDQCAHVGELHHALNQGMSLNDVHAELGEIILGKKPGRQSQDEIIVFDSTGTSLQDVASAAAVYEKAVESGVGKDFDFFQ